jgi:Family of unknown function (DUF5723)
MKYYLPIIFLLFTASSIFSQDYTGIHSSIHFPLQNISNQPTGIVEDSTKWHINVLTTQIGLMKSFSLKENEIWDKISNAGLPDLEYFFATEKSRIYAHGQLLLPSLSYKINNNNAVSLWFNVRADGIYSYSNADIMNLFNGTHTSNLSKTVNDENFRGLVHTWMEYNLTYSTLLWEDSNQKLHGGVTLKLVEGGSSGYFDIDAINLSFNNERIEYFKMNLSYGMNKNLDEAINNNNNNNNSTNLFSEIGFGVDLGFSYKFIPDYIQENKNIPYKFKIGFVINDLGSVKHDKNTSKEQFDISIEDVPYSRFKGIESINGLIDSIQKSISFEESKGGSFKVDLPTKYTLTADYNVFSYWFIHSSVTYRPNLYARLVEIIELDIWSCNLTPRFENKNWGAYVPLSWNNKLGWKAGLSIRWKYIFIGSETVLSNLFIQEREIMEVYLGTNIPIGKRN